MDRSTPPASWPAWTATAAGSPIPGESTSVAFPRTRTTPAPSSRANSTSPFPAPRASSGQEQQLAGGAAGLQVLVCLASLVERVTGADPDGQRATLDRVEHVTGSPGEFLPGRRVVGQCGAGDEQGAARVEPLQVK